MASQKKAPAGNREEAPPVRKRAGHTSEETILAAAEGLFARHGYDGVSTKQLAAAAGVTIGALYHHFAGKEALYEAATRRAFSRRSAVPKKLVESQAPARERLTQQVAWFVGSLITDKNFGLLLRRELLDPRSDAKRLVYLDVFQQALGLFKDLIQQLAPEADADVAVASMLALVFGFANLKGLYAIVAGVRKSLSTPEQIAEHATRLLLGGLRA